MSHVKYSNHEVILKLKHLNGQRKGFIQPHESKLYKISGDIYLHILEIDDYHYILQLNHR